MSLTAEATRAQLFAVLEGTDGSNYGVTPATPTFLRVRNIGNTPSLTKNSLTSKELKGNRMPADLRHGTRTVAGDIDTEFAYAWADPYIESVLGGTWTAPAVAAAKITLSAAAVDNSFNDSATTMPVVAAGDLIMVSGFATAANNGVFKVVSRTTSKIIVAANTPLTLEVAGTSVKLQPMGKLSAGTTRRSWSILRYFSDLDSSKKPYHLFTGCEFNSMAVTIVPEDLVSLKFGVVGCDMTLSTTAPASSTLSPANVNLPMDAFAGNVVEGTANIAIATKIEFTLANGIAPRYVIGTDKSLQPSIAEAGLTGTMTIYFDSSTLLEKFINETESTLLVAINDPAGNTYVFEFPRIKYTDAALPVATGSLQITMPFNAQEETVSGVGTGTNVRIWRAPA